MLCLEIHLVEYPEHFLSVIYIHQDSRVIERNILDGLQECEGWSVLQEACRQRN